MAAMKKFLILGNMNAITYKEIFTLIKGNKIWLGVNPKGGSRKGNIMGFIINDEVGYVPAWWYTNIDHNKRHIPLKLTKSYNATDYPLYDNYNGINVNKTVDIPMDYNGVMGVPVSFLDKYCPEQFEIVKFRKGDDDKDLSINGKCPYFRVLIKSKKMKKFLVIGNVNAVTYKEIFPLLRENKIWNGVTLFCGKMPYFKVDADTDISTGNHYYDEQGNLYKQVNSICWFTNLDHQKRHEPLDLYKKYSPEEFPKYDNYDAIEVSKVCDIPLDYDGVMGVPITFLDKYCPEQFEVIGITENADYLKPLYVEGCEKYDRPYLSGKRMYSRLLIKSK